MPRDSLKILAINAAILAAGSVLVLAGLELYLRLTVPASSLDSIFHYTLETPRYKLMKPNAAVLAWGKELRTNALGFRDNDGEIPPKRAGEFRIIVLGDSFTVSAGVDFERIYTSALERRLAARFPGVSVVNLAVGGYNIVQYAHVLQEVGLALEPDLVLVAVFPDNDFSMDNYELNYKVAAGAASALPERAWHETTYVYRAYGRKLEAKLKGWFGTRREAKQGWQQNTAALGAIALAARERNIPLAVALLPHTFHFENQRALFGRVARFCGEQDIHCISLLEPFAAAGVPEASLRLNPLDAHPNEKYNAVIAEHLAAYLSGFLSAGARLSPNGPAAFDAIVHSAR